MGAAQHQLAAIRQALEREPQLAIGFGCSLASAVAAQLMDLERRVALVGVQELKSLDDFLALRRAERRLRSPKFVQEGVSEDQGG